MICFLNFGVALRVHLYQSLNFIVFKFPLPATSSSTIYKKGRLGSTRKVANKQEVKRFSADFCACIYMC